MTLQAPDNDTELLLNAYLDGELDAVAAKQFEERMANEPVLRSRLDKLAALGSSIRSELPSDFPSEALRTRIGGGGGRPRHHVSRWQALAASLVVGVLVGSAATFSVLPRQGGEPLADQIVAAHIRAMMAPQPIDVASSDRHTVKPWFDGKIAFAPEVIDLAAAGFPLVGGRIDVVNLEPVPALVYRAGKHLVTLVEMPEERRTAEPVTSTSSRGFGTLTWSDGKVTYWVVSDASSEEVQAFAMALRAAAPP
jgi:anti-sigma factor RsiW